jgi:outer membrane protein assembly factor BamD
MISFLLTSILVMIRYLTLFVSSIFLAGCFIFGEPTEFDETTGQSPEWIYDRAEVLKDQRDFRKSINFLEKLIKRYPDNKLIPSARLNLAYAYYKFGQKELSTSTVNQFITLYPSHPSMDYAYYLKGLNLYQERGIINKLTMQDISDRDVNNLKQAFDAFSELVKKFPDSKYSQDSTDRMTYLMNKIAEYDLHVARYYMKRKAYVAALNRAKNLYTSYPESIHVEESLVIQYIAYKELKLTDLEVATKKVIDHNYPNNKLALDINEGTKTWWKFWESLTD